MGLTTHETQGKSLQPATGAEAAKSRARNNTIAAFDDTLNALRSYIERYPDSEERVRLLGAEPALRDVRYQFERATAPEDES
jgi:hypothetical protein